MNSNIPDIMHMATKVHMVLRRCVVLNRMFYINRELKSMRHYGQTQSQHYNDENNNNNDDKLICASV